MSNTWTAHHSSTHKQIYYFNQQTGEQRWVPPEGIIFEWIEYMRADGGKFYFNPTTGEAKWANEADIAQTESPLSPSPQTTPPSQPQNKSRELTLVARYWPKSSTGWLMYILAIGATLGVSLGVGLKFLRA